MIELNSQSRLSLHQGNKHKVDTSLWDNALNGLVKDKQIQELFKNGKKFYEICCEE